MARKVVENEWLILKTNQGLRVLTKATKTPDHPYIKIGKCQLEPKWLLEHACIGSTYEIHTNDVQVCPERNDEASYSSQVPSEEASNEYLLDNNTAQKLTADEVAQMKAEGISGKEVVNALMQNSETFKDKTAYAKDKYIERKIRKHCQQFTIYPVNLTELTEFKYNRGLSNATGLRFDYLYHMLQYVESGSNVLVLDQSTGLLLGGVIQKLAGKGCLYQLTKKKMKDISATRLNMPPAYYKVVRKIDLDTVMNKLKMLEINSKAKYKQSGMMCDEVNEEEEPSYEELEKRKVNLILAVLQADDKNSLNYLLMILECIKRILIPNGRFCICSANFAHIKIASAELLDYSFGVRCEELFLREYQIAFNKTHPLMEALQRIYSGFLIYGFRLHDD